MLEVGFLELHLTACDSSFQGSGTYDPLPSSKDRCCKKRISLHASSVRELQELHDKLHGDDAIENAGQTAILKQLATLCLRDGRKKGESTAASLVRGEEKTPSRAPTAQLQTLNAENDVDDKKPIFEGYYTPNSKKKLEDPKEVDKKVQEILTSLKIETQTREFLYIFGSKDAERAYKVGHGASQNRPKEGYNKCYRGLEVHYTVACCNAERFERVVHAELAQSRLAHRCDQCGKKHGEWFEAPLKVIRDSVEAWSVYANTLYQKGLDIEGNIQRLPFRGFSTRPDRWQKWARQEVSRWEGMSPSPTTKGSTLKKIDEMQSAYESDSEVESDRSSPLTSGSTPATTPGSSGEEYNGFGVPPSRTQRNSVPVSIFEDDTFDEDYEAIKDRPEKPVNRALFSRSSEISPRIDIKESHTKVTENAQSTRRGSLALSGTNSVFEASPTDTASGKLTDGKMRKVLEQNARCPYNPGFIYLTPCHPKTEAYKIYYRGKGTRRKGECYSNQEPYFKIECKNAKGVQDLVLAEFDGSTQKHTCGLPVCQREHKNWIKASSKAIEASLRAWTALLDTGYKSSDIPKVGFSPDTDRWRKWANKTAANDLVFERDSKKAGSDESTKCFRRTSTF